VIKQQQNNAALYLRLSRDDGGDAESNSIGTQREILRRYARESGFDLYGEYIDDGISGTTFERPNFQRMISDVEAGKIGIILCKDLSRLGRNNAMVAYFTEIFFIEKSVRFIALNDGIDTFKGDNEIMPFKSVINEYYARDISKKIRSAYRAQAHKGVFTGSIAPYGYMKSPENKHLLIPNPDTVEPARSIFEMAAQGKSTVAIAKALTAQGYLTPSAYVRKHFGYGHKGGDYRHDTDWSPCSIGGILRNRVYVGQIVSCKSTSQSFKSKKVVRLPEDEHVVVENTHEGLVTQDTFDRIQDFLSLKKRGNKRDFDNIFQGFMKCADCGAGFSVASPNGKEGYFGYNCTKHRQHYCTSHYISYKNIYRIVLEALQEKLAFVQKNESELTQYAQKLASQANARDMKFARSELGRSRKRSGELDALIQKLFEQNAAGLLTDERFFTLSSTYETEQRQVKERIAQMQARLDEQDEGTRNAMRFFEIVRKYTEITELDTRVLRDLVDCVVIHKPEGRGKARTQKVVVNFRFIKDNWFSS